MNDDEIINLFLKRDENGIIELSTKYHPYCYKIAWNLLANREDAEECLNDTWFSVRSQIPPTHPPVLAHFCGRITRNLSIDHLRKKAILFWNHQWQTNDIHSKVYEMGVAYRINQLINSRAL